MSVKLINKQLIRGCAMNILQQFIKSFYKFDEYPLLIQTRGIKVFFYIVLLIFISMSPIVGKMASLYYKLGGISGIVDTYVPEFSINDNILSTDEKINFEDEQIGVAIVLDTEKNFKLEDYQKFTSYMLIGKDKTYIKSNSAVKEFDYKLFNNLSKKDVTKFYPVIKQIIATTCISLYLFCFISNITMILLLMIISNIVNIFIGAKLKFSEMFKLVVYSITMPTMLRTVLILIGVNMPRIIFLGTACAYFYFSLKSVKQHNGIIIAVL